MDSRDVDQLNVVAGLAVGALFFLILALVGIVQIFSGDHPSGLQTVVASAVIALLLGGSAFGLRPT